MSTPKADDKSPKPVTAPIKSTAPPSPAPVVKVPPLPATPAPAKPVAAAAPKKSSIY